MKLSPKLLIVASALVVIALYITNQSPVIDPAPTQEKPTQGIAPASTKEQSKTARHPQNSNSPQSSETLSPAEAIKQDINNAYISLLKNGDLSLRKTMHLEDDWCLANEDLKPSEAKVYNADVMDWYKERGHFFERDKFSDLGINNEYIEPYLEMSDEALLQLANKNDFMALHTLLNKTPVYEKKANDYARRLLILGDTHSGLNHFVSNHLFEANEQYQNNGNQITESIKNHVMQALAYAEYGMMRKDFTAMSTALFHASRANTSGDGLNMEKVIQEIDTSTIHQLAVRTLNDINQARLAQNLASIDLTHSKNIELHYQESLALAMHLNPEYFQKQWFPKEWRSDYIEQTECVQRHLKWHTFMGETLPKLQQEYVRLTQPNSN